LLATLVVVVVLECLLRLAYLGRSLLVTEIPLPYAVGDDFGPIPPWQDGERILEPDHVLFWRARRNMRRAYVDVFGPAPTEDDRRALLRSFLPGLPAWLRDNPRWEISLNSEGFRGAEFPATKSPSAFRVVCLGDSWTFGANVGQSQAYPQRLQALLAQEFPGARVEVLNLGVLGYSSYQGRQLLGRRGLALQPDVVVIGFAMNDASVTGYRDKDLAGSTATRARRVERVTEHLETYKLLRYLASRIRYRPVSLAAQLMRSRGSTVDADYSQLEPWTRVSPVDYELNVREMIHVARAHGARVLLLHNALETGTPYSRALQGLSRAESVPLVDGAALIAAERDRLERSFEERLNLDAHHPTAPADGRVEVILRVLADGRQAPRGVFVVGAHPKLGDLVPNRVRMHDDGTHADQRAGDGVWSYAVTVKPGTRLAYVYTTGAVEGRWEGLDVPWIRRFTVEAPRRGGTLYRPIETFGKIGLLADPWHTDARGYDLIARAVLDELRPWLPRPPRPLTAR
jgi:lysophospholipase L1-like esterase